MNDYTIPLSVQITCVRREIAFRESLYPKWVEAKRIKKEVADRELVTMRAVLSTLISLDVSGGRLFDG
jgi:hypothetical protein